MNKRDGATDSIRWHRLSCSDNGYVSGYISDDGDWIVGRSGRQATVWQYVPETEINNRDGSEPGGPWHKDLGLIDTVNGRWFVHMWDSVTIGDAKYEVGMLVNGTGIKEGN